MILCACTEAKPVAPSAKKAGTTEPAPPSPPFEPPTDAGDPTDSLAPDCDPNKDFNQLDFPQDIKDCLKTGKIYNFDANTCTTMNKATFDCTFDSVKSELTNVELPTAPLSSQEAKGAKLIGCGASNDGYTFVTQFWFKKAGGDASDCSYTKQGKVVSVCYQKSSLEQAQTAPTGEEAQKASVAKCMVE